MQCWGAPVESPTLTDCQGHHSKWQLRLEYWKMMIIRAAYQLPSIPWLPPELCMYRVRFQEFIGKMTVDP